MPLRVVLVDDHEVVRNGIKALLEETHDVSVVGEAGTVKDAIARVESARPQIEDGQLLRPVHADQLRSRPPCGFTRMPGATLDTGGTIRVVPELVPSVAGKLAGPHAGLQCWRGSDGGVIVAARVGMEMA